MVFSQLFIRYSTAVNIIDLGVHCGFFRRFHLFQFLEKVEAAFDFVYKFTHSLGMNITSPFFYIHI
jgi:hypothetical protein